MRSKLKSAHSHHKCEQSTKVSEDLKRTRRIRLLAITACHITLFHQAGQSEESQSSPPPCYLVLLATLVERKQSASTQQLCRFCVTFNKSNKPLRIPLIFGYQKLPDITFGFCVFINIIMEDFSDDEEMAITENEVMRRKSLEQLQEGEWCNCCCRF